MTILTIGVAVLCVISTALATYFYLEIRKANAELVKQQAFFEEEKKRVANLAKRRSGAVQWGYAIENFVPFMPKFPIPPEDVNYLGMPIDYVGFTDTDKPGKCTVHFIEVKSGNSVLSKKQWNIRKAINEGRVVWHELRVDANRLKSDQ
jgi:predicted Holliday junction resolvase-like endonuclease